MGDTIMLTSDIVIALAFSTIAVLLGVIGYFLRSLHRDFRDVERNLPEKYVRKDDFLRAISDLKDDFQRSTSELKVMLQQIFNKLDTKQDK